MTHIAVIHTDEQRQAHIDKLIVIEPRFVSIYEQVGLPDLHQQPQGFAQMVRAIIAQQISASAARRIYQRIEQAGLMTPNAIQVADDDHLQKQGLSKQKIRYLRSLAEHDIDYDTLAYLSDEAVIKQLTAVTGVGRWTAQMYLLFSLRRVDILPVDDLAIKVAAQALLGLDKRPTPNQLTQLTNPWSPHRSVASLLLWAYYGVLKNQAG